MSDYSGKSSAELWDILNKKSQPTDDSQELRGGSLVDKETGLTKHQMQVADANLRKAGKKYPHKETTGETVTRGLVRGAKNLGVGAVSLIPDLALLPARGLHKLTGHGYSGRSVSDLTNELVDELSGGYTKEYTPRENQQRAALEMIGGQSPSGAAGKWALSAGAKATGYGGKATRGLGHVLNAGSDYTLTNTLSSGLAGAAAQGTIDKGGSGMDAFIASVMAGAAPGTVKKGVKAAISPKQTAKKALADVLSIDPEKVKDFEKSGVKGMTLADVTASPNVKFVQNAARAMPFSGEVLDSSIKDKIASVKDIIGYDKGNSPNVAGKHAHDIVSNLRESKAAQSGKLKQKFLDKLPEKMDIETALGSQKLPLHFDVTEILKPLEKHRAGKYGDAIHAEALPKYLDIEKAVNPNITKKGKWADNREFNRIFDEIKGVTEGSFDGISNAGKGAHKHLHGNFIESLDKNIKNISPEAAYHFDKFKKHYAHYAKEDIPRINKILAAESKVGESKAFKSVYDDLFNADGRTARTVLREAKSSERKQLTQDILSEMARDSKEQFSMTSFANNYKKLKAKPKSFDMAMSGLKNYEKKNLENVIKSIEHTQETMRHQNFSNTNNSKVAIGLISGTGVGTGTMLVQGDIGGAAMAATAGALSVAIPYAFTKGIATNPKLLKTLGEARTLNNPSKTLVWMDKLEKYGAPVKAVRKAYANQLLENAKYSGGARLTSTATKATLEASNRETPTFEDEPQGYAKGGSVQYKEGSGEHEHGVEAHFNRHELAIMDEYQRGRSIDEKTKLPEYSVLGLMAEKNPNIVHQLIQDFAEAHSGEKAEHEHLHGKLAEEQKDGRFGDTELALIPHNLANLFDEAIGNVTRNPEDGKREYFWGAIAGLASRALPALLKVGTTVGRAALPALKTAGSAIMAAGKASMPVLKTVGQGIVKYAPKVLDVANKTGISNAVGQIATNAIMNKINPQPQPQEEQQYQQPQQQYEQPEQQGMDINDLYSTVGYQPEQQQFMQPYNNSYQNNYYMDGYEHGGRVRRHYSQGGEIAGSILGTVIPGADFLVNAIDEVAHGQKHLTASDQYRMIKRQDQSDQAQTNIINNVNAKQEAYEKQEAERAKQAAAMQNRMSAARDYSRSSRDATLSYLKNRQDKMIANGLDVSPEGRYQDPKDYPSGAYYGRYR